MKMLKYFGAVWMLYTCIMGFLEVFKYQLRDPGKCALFFCISPVFLIAYVIWKKLSDKHEREIQAKLDAERAAAEAKNSGSAASSGESSGKVFSDNI